jgi:isopropylmalate/homocitrate/citramalate synthase
VRNADANANRVAKWYTYFYPDTYGGSISDTYGGSVSYTYRNAKLHTELHIHNGNRSDRAGNHRHW